MSDGPLKLLLPELEVEVLSEALELYLSTRRTPADPRFEYRYRTAQAVLEALQQPAVEPEEPMLARPRARNED